MFEDIKTVIVESLNLSPETVTLTAHLRDDLGIDSLDAAELIMELEDKFELKIDEAQAGSFATVQHIVDFITTAKQS